MEAPIEVRVCTSFLRNLRNQLAEWKISQKSVKIDRDAGTLKVQGEEVVQVKVINDELIINWLKEDGKTCDGLHKSRELELLVRTSGLPRAGREHVYRCRQRPATVMGPWERGLSFAPCGQKFRSGT